jgi:hypothetical protein
MLFYVQILISSLEDKHFGRWSLCDAILACNYSPVQEDDESVLDWLYY